MNNQFAFSVIRVVPDPIKDEAVNVGVVVVSEDGSSGCIRYSDKFRTRINVLKRDFPIASVSAAIEDLKTYLGLEAQPSFGVKPTPIQGAKDRLEEASKNFENQLQITSPKVYLAESLDIAATQLFRRYVASRLPRQVPEREMTAAELRDRIWQNVRELRKRNLSVQRNGWLTGQEARHPADFVIKNGVQKAAIFALAASDSERVTSYLYRDSLPTIANDMGPHFKVIGVLPDVDETTPDSVRKFIEETHTLLRGYDQVHTTSLRELPAIAETLERSLFR
jgi:hypothetical protein